MNLLSEFLNHKQDGIYCIGHASYLARLSGELYLFDPIWNHEPYGYWTLWPEHVDFDFLLPQIKGCFVSHHHSDHLCDGILDKLQCPIYVMSGRPSMSSRMKKRRNLYEARSNQLFNFGRNIAMWQKHDFNTVDSSLFVRSSSGFVFYHGNDNFIKSASSKLCAEVLGPVTVAAIPWTFVHYYPMLLTDVDHKWLRSEIARCNKQSLDSAVETAEILKAKVNIPCGGSLFYKADMFNALNLDITDPYEFCRKVRQSAPVIAGGYVLADGRIATSTSNLRQYLRGLREHLFQFQTVRDKSAIKMTSKRMKLLRQKLDKCHKKINHMLLISVNESWIKIDLNPAKKHKPITVFNFESDVLNKWLDGEISFEQALGTRRFRYEKLPNIYDIDVMEFYNNYL